MESKGNFHGKCNRTACDKEGSVIAWFNRYTEKYYCGVCASMINDEDCNIRSAERDFGVNKRICYKVFKSDGQD